MDSQRDQTDNRKLGELSEDKPELAVTLADRGSIGSISPILWTPEEDRRLRAAVGRLMHIRPIQWHLIAQELPQKTLDEILKRTNKLIQGIQGELLSDVLSFHCTNGPVSMDPRHQLVVFQPSEENQNTHLVSVVEKQCTSSQFANRKTPQPWTEDEKQNFEKGVRVYGWGNWKLITQTYLPTRTPFQVASYAQKFKNRLQNGNLSTKRRRTRIKTDDINSRSRSLSPTQPQKEL